MVEVVNKHAYVQLIDRLHIGMNPYFETKKGNKCLKYMKFG